MSTPNPVAPIVPAGASQVEIIIALLFNSALQIAQLAFPGASAIALAAIAMEFVMKQVEVMRNHGLAISDADVLRWRTHALERATILAPPAPAQEEKRE